MNIQDLADQIEKKAKVNVLALPVGKRLMIRGADGKMLLIKAGEPWPAPPDGSVVMALFQGEGEVRVYTLAADEESKKGEEPKRLPPPTRYTVSKHVPSIFAEIMSGETFIDEIANEWVMVDEAISTAERERAAVVGMLRAQNHVVAIGLADRIEAGEHLEKDDEDDEPEGVVTSASAPVAPAS
jgi:hypothetical protein